jgi:hypothetical protein
MTTLAEPSTPSGSSPTTKKATDHELQKHDNFTRYGQAGLPRRPHAHLRNPLGKVVARLSTLCVMFDQ